MNKNHEQSLRIPAGSPAPYGPIASPRQLRWHRHEFYGFVHFGLNTFTDREWGYGDDPPGVFAPRDFDAGQVAGTAVAAGMAGLILTCKHHDGFCLWPSSYTEYSVRNSPWRSGRGDLVREMADACRNQGLLFGVYLSPWDRNHAAYGTPEYVDYYRKQLRELTTGYGELFEVWFDGANGGDGYYGGAREIRRIDRRTYYGWRETWDIVRRNQPDAVIFSDAGPDVRWVGNERGVAGDPCWSTLSADSLYPGFGGDDWMTHAEPDMVKAWASDPDLLNHGDRHGTSWLPAECDVSIRPGWFYHSSQDDQVRGDDNLFEIYCRSVGRGASLLLNLPPDRRGLIHERDVSSLLAFRRRRDAVFGRDLARAARVTASHTRNGRDAFAPARLVDGNPETFWTTDDHVSEADFVVEFPETMPVNMVGLREYLPLGQRVERYYVDVEEKGRWRECARGHAIGNLRLARFPVCRTRRVRCRLEGPVGPALSAVSLYHDPAV